ncbi:MAG: hypothetical protein H8D65_01845 [Spirochaetes bacterium]|nr:hypothetical protein [Spirochaetota bacterium]
MTIMKRTPEQVNVYDIGKGEGWVSKDVEKDTAVCTVESVRRLWDTMG